MKNDKYIQGDLLDMGFTRKLISELLPEPQQKRSSYHGYYYLWDKSDVDKAMMDQRFIKMQEKRQERKERAEATAGKRYDKTMEKITKLIEGLTPPQRIPIDELRKLAIESRAEWYDEIRYDYDGYDNRDAYGADNATIERWIVNYIRHEMTNYDIEVSMANMKYQVGRIEAFNMYETAVYDSIKSVYPELEKECDRQLQRHLNLIYGSNNYPF